MDVLFLIISWVVIILSIIVHECAHGYMAYMLGDPTAKNAGRLTLNPLKHLDYFGSIILPIILLLSRNPLFGFAKPVPYNPRYFKNLKRDEILVALAGPFSNLVLVFLGLSFVKIAQFASSYLIVFWVTQIGILIVSINLSLMLFNLLPIPPLDGSSLLITLVPKKYLGSYYKIQHYSMPVLFMLLLVLPMVFNIDPVGYLLFYLKSLLFSVFGLL